MGCDGCAHRPAMLLPHLAPSPPPGLESSIFSPKSERLAAVAAAVVVLFAFTFQHQLQLPPSSPFPQQGPERRGRGWGRR